VPPVSCCSCSSSSSRIPRYSNGISLLLFNDQDVSLVPFPLYPPDPSSGRPDEPYGKPETHRHDFYPNHSAIVGPPDAYQLLK
jgi:hypothetical protein